LTPYTVSVSQVTQLFQTISIFLLFGNIYNYTHKHQQVKIQISATKLNTGYPTQTHSSWRRSQSWQFQEAGGNILH